MPIGGGRKNARTSNGRIRLHGAARTWCSGLWRPRTTIQELAEGRTRQPQAAATPTRSSSVLQTRWSLWTRSERTTSASQQLIGNIYQNLLSVPAGGNKPEPDAAESCDWSDDKTYVCKLKPDLKFSSGDPLTAEDVKFSLDRMVKIEDPTGPYTLLASLDSVEATDPTDGDDEAQQGRRDLALHPHP